MKNELRNVLSGKSEVRFGKIIQAISSYVGESTKTGAADKGTKLFRKQEAEVVEKYSIDTVFYLTDNFWIDKLN